MEMKSAIVIAIYSLFNPAAWAEPAPPAPKEFANFAMITGFHAHLDQASQFEFRILEVDGSATIAMNPIRLFLVVTNHASGEELQSRVVHLPSVSALKKIRFLDRPDTISIEATFDRTSGDGAKHLSVTGTIEISIPIRQGKLPMVIDATTKTPEAESER